MYRRDKSLAGLSPRGTSEGASQSGAILLGAPFLTIGVLMLLGLAYDGYRIRRESVEQDRLARSIGIVALKAYERAGCNFDYDNLNTGRVKYALQAAAEAWDPSGNFRQQISEVELPTSEPVEARIAVEDDSSSGEVIIRFGRVIKNSKGVYSLTGVRPCTVVAPPANAPQGPDTWAAGRPVPALSVPDDFNWYAYISANKDLGVAGIDSKVEAERHLLEYGMAETRQGKGPVFTESGRGYGVQVALKGMRVWNRNTSFMRLVGLDRFILPVSSVLVVRDLTVPQALQVDEIDISARDGKAPPKFVKPVGGQLADSAFVVRPGGQYSGPQVEYTMSMDIRIDKTSRGWRNVFNSHPALYGDKFDVGPSARRPALFISGEDSHTGINRVFVVHGSSTEDNSGVTSDFEAKLGETFNVTWTVRGGQLRLYINGVFDNGTAVEGTTDQSIIYPFNWSKEKDWQWNAYWHQFPENMGYFTAGPIFVRNVFWWNKALSAAEVADIKNRQSVPYESPFQIFTAKNPFS